MIAAAYNCLYSFYHFLSCSRYASPTEESRSADQEENLMVGKKGCRCSRQAEAALKLNKVNSKLRLGSLNKEPFPFEETLKLISAAQEEKVQAEINPHSYALKRLLRNLTAEEQECVTQIKEDEEGLPEEVASALRAGKWDHEIFSSPRFGQYTVQAFMQKKISIEQLATVFMRWEASVQFSHSGNPLLTHPLFQKGDFTQDAIMLLIPSLWEISAAEKIRFIYKLLQSPLSERYFWTVKIPQEDYEKGEKRKKYGKVLYNLQTRLPLFTLRECPEDLDQMILVIPSFSILKAYLWAVHREHAVAVIPEFGIGTPKQIEFDIPQNQRLFALQFPNIKGLESGDGYYFGEYLASFHDFYHCHRISLIPPLHRLAYLRLAHIFKHCLTLSQRYPHEPLLTVYWSQQTDWRYKEIGKIHKFDPIPEEYHAYFHQRYFEEIIDLELPAADGYLNLFWKRESIHLNDDWKKVKHPFLAEKLPFRPFMYYHPRLNGDAPETQFELCVALHDMVVNADAWKQNFNIDGLYQRRWIEDPMKGIIDIQGHLIEGFRCEAISMPSEDEEPF